MHVYKNNVSIPTIGLPVDFAIRPLLGRGMEAHGAARVAVVPELLEEEATQSGRRAACVIRAKERSRGADPIKGLSSTSLAHVNSWAVRPMVVTADESDPPIPVRGVILRVYVGIPGAPPSDHSTGFCAAEQ